MWGQHIYIVMPSVLVKNKQKQNKNRSLKINNLRSKIISKKIAPKSKARKSPLKHPLATHLEYSGGFDNTHVLGVPNSLGKFTPINCVTRTVASTNETYNRFIIVQFTNSNLNCFLLDGETRVVTQYGSSQLLNTPPIEMRQLKMSVEFCNSTVFTDIVGTVRTLMIPNMINWNWDLVGTLRVGPATLTTITNLMNSHPDVETKSAMDYSKSRTFITTAGGFQAFTSYYEYQTASNATIGQQVMSMVDPAISPVNGSTTYFGAPPPVSTVLIIELLPVAKTNSYDIVVKQQIAAKYSADNLLSNMAVDPKICSATKFQADNAKVAQGGSAGVHTEHLAMAHATKNNSSSKKFGGVITS